MTYRVFLSPYQMKFNCYAAKTKETIQSSEYTLKIWIVRPLLLSSLVYLIENTPPPLISVTRKSICIK